MSRAHLVASVLAAVLTIVSFAAAIAPAVAASGQVHGTARIASAANLLAASQPPRSGRAELAQSILSRLKSSGVPRTAVYLPNFMSQVQVSGGVVHPLYTTAPAPMGVGDFGVRNTTGTPTAYILNSTSWEGTLSVNDANALYLDDGVPDWWGPQLNAVLTNTTVAGNTTGTYWIQNVFDYSSVLHSLTFIDNIWNFSNPSTNEPASTFFSYNGTPVDPTFYYDVGPTFTVQLPFTIHLYVNSSLTVNATTHEAWSTVRFGYDLLNGTGGTIGSGFYDTVLFNSQVTTASNPPVPKFSVNGFTPNPVGLLDDSELMIGGPGGGSTTTMFAMNGTMQLRYLDNSTGTYVNDPTAWNEGTDTGETVEGIAEYYTTPGTVFLGSGPSIPMPLWNATPGGNLGKAVLQGTLSPSNGFVFVNQGTSFNDSQAAFAPTAPDGQFSWALPPGDYYVQALASEHDPFASVISWASGTTAADLTLTLDPALGVYTPLWAWDNAQLANISIAGDGSAANPYVIDNNEFLPIDPLFGEFNDYVYGVFPGIFLAYTDAHVDVSQPAPFNVQYPAFDARSLNFFGLPDTNNLGIEAYDASSISVWQGSFTGWFTSIAYNLPPYAPMANVAFWNVTDSLIGDSTFADQGSAVLLALGTRNTVWGNTILPGSMSPGFYGYPYVLGIQVFEGGDRIYNNYATVTIPALEWDEDFYTGAPQVNLDDWNLSAAEPASQVNTVNGHRLTGSIVGSPWQCGNFWGNYVPGSGLPYTDVFFIPWIQEGGDFCPYPLTTYAVTFTETGLASGTWGIAMGGTVLSAAAGSPIVFQMPDGSWDYHVGAVAGHTVTPSDGTVTVSGAAQSVAIAIGGALTASETASPSPTDVGQAVAFAATVNGGASPYTFSWSFGDGSGSSAQSPSHAYAGAGTYAVDLWVNDSSGGSQHLTDSVTVNAVPTASATASTDALDVGQLVAFTGSSTGGTGSATYSWDFGDGTHSSVSSLGHAYAGPGAFTVTLTVTDAAGVSATATVSVTVAALPVATASASTNAPATGVNVTFTGASTGGTGAIAYTWSFGDGARSSAQSPGHTYTSAGTYTVHLWANDTSGGSSMATLTVVVSIPAPTDLVSSSTATIYAIIGLVVGIVIGALVMLVLRRRGGASGSGTPPKEESP